MPVTEGHTAHFQTPRYFWVMTLVLNLQPERREGYDPYFGRFLSPDPIVQSPQNPQNYNRYSYALNNPLKYTDPSGMNYAPHPDDEDLFENEAMAIYHSGNAASRDLSSHNKWMWNLRDASSNWNYMGSQRFNSMYGTNGNLDAYETMTKIHNSRFYHLNGPKFNKLLEELEKGSAYGFNYYFVEAFNRLSVVGSNEKGNIGDIEIYRGGINFTAPGAGRYLTTTPIGTENISQISKHTGISFYKKRNPYFGIAANYYHEGYRYGKKGDYFNYRLQGIFQNRFSTINGFNEANLNFRYSAYKSRKRKQAFREGLDNGIQFDNYFESLNQDEQNGIWIFRLNLDY